jgi:O-succinylbenzoic acid--CoA ligase
MAELVALDLPGGPDFVRALSEAWERGQAVAPLDRRLAKPARRRLLEALRPSWVIDGQGRHPCQGALETEDGDALVVATSGSTGVPKAAVLTHTAVAASARATSARLGVQPGCHRWLACLPLSHIGGLSVVTRALLTGADLVVHDGFDADRVAGAAGPEVLVSLVPTALARVGASRFAKVLLGGSAPPAALPPNVVTTYGMTETGSGVVYDGVPLPGVDVRLSPAGEVLLRGPMLLRAYRDGTAPLDKEGWLATGDAGHFDARGHLHVDGRLSDMVVTGGENVWPAAVEHAIGHHKGISEVAISSRPDPEWGERLVACVVPSDPASPPALADLRALVSKELAPFAAPKELVLMAQLPKTASGKIRRDELRRQLSAPTANHH